MREQLSKLFTETLKPIYIGKEYNGRKIIDVDVIIGEKCHMDDHGGVYYDDITINIKTQFGKRVSWERMDLY